MNIFTSLWLNNNTIFLGKVHNDVPHRTPSSTQFPHKLPVIVRDHKAYIANIDYIDFWTTFEAADIPTQNNIPSIALFPWMSNESLVGKRLKDVLIELICAEVHPVYTPGTLSAIHSDEIYYACIDQIVELAIQFAANDSKNITAIRVEYNNAAGTKKSVAVALPTDKAGSPTTGYRFNLPADKYMPGKTQFTITVSYAPISADKKTNWGNTEPVPAPHNAAYSLTVTTQVDCSLPIVVLANPTAIANNPANTAIANIQDLTAVYKQVFKAGGITEFLHHFSIPANNNYIRIYIPNSTNYALANTNIYRTVSINDAFDITPSFTQQTVNFVLTSGNSRTYAYSRWDYQVGDLAYTHAVMHTLRQYEVK